MLARELLAAVSSVCASRPFLSAIWLDQPPVDTHADDHWWTPLAGLVHLEPGASWLSQIAKQSVYLMLDGIKMRPSISILL